MGGRIWNMIGGARRGSIPSSEAPSGVAVAAVLCSGLLPLLSYVIVYVMGTAFCPCPFWGFDFQLWWRLSSYEPQSKPE